MPQPLHPAVSDVQALYAAAGLIPDPTAAPYSSINWAAQLAAAISSFAARTGRRFPAAFGTRVYDPPTNHRGRLSLRGDLASDGPAGSIVVTASGLPQLAGRDYFLGPDNADGDGRPWTWIELPALSHSYWPGQTRRSVQISGLWGYSSQVPDDVWEAERQGAALLCAAEVSVTVSNGVYKIDDVSYSGAGQAIPLATEASLWKATFERVVAANARVINFME